MHFVVTGAGGFIGSHLCEHLLAQGHTVLGVDAFTDYYDPSLKRANLEVATAMPGFSLVVGDVLTADLPGLLDGADALIHLAGQPGVRLSWADSFEVYAQRNVVASQRVLEAARVSGVDRVVLASSSSVYGNAAACPTAESAPTRPFSPYGVTKLAMEQLAWSYVDNWDLPVVALRYFTVYGPRQRPDMALHRFIEHAHRGEEVRVFGDGEQVRDFTYVSDVVRATAAAAAADLAPGTVLNVAGGSSATVREVLEIVARHTGADPRVRHDPGQAGDVRATGGAIERARELLGWEPLVPLDDGIRRQVVSQADVVGRVG